MCQAVLNLPSSDQQGAREEFNFSPNFHQFFHLKMAPPVVIGMERVKLNSPVRFCFTHCKFMFNRSSCQCHDGSEGLRVLKFLPTAAHDGPWPIRSSAVLPRDGVVTQYII